MESNNLFIINFVYHKTGEDGLRHDFYYGYRIMAMNESEAENKASEELKKEHNIDFKKINSEYKNGDYCMMLCTEAKYESERGLKYNSTIARIDVIGDGEVKINDIYSFLVEDKNTSEGLRNYAKEIVKAREKKREDK